MFDVEGMSLAFQGPLHEFCVTIGHGFDVPERGVVDPNCHRSSAEVRAERLDGRDQRESFLLYRAVVPLGSSKLAAQVAYGMLYIVHNLEQNCTQTSLGSINCYREWQVIIGRDAKVLG